MENNLIVKASSIAGSGVFAEKDFKAGELIHVMQGKLGTLEEMIELVNQGKEEPSDPLGVDDEVYLDLDELSRSFNHSCDPNAYIRGKYDLVAMRDIKTGEEINYDYSTTMNDNAKKIAASGRTVWTEKCHCGAKICRGIIDQFKTLPIERQRYYVEHKYMPDFVWEKFK